MTHRLASACAALAVAIGVAELPASSSALSLDFEALPEGSCGTTCTIGGVTFVDGQDLISQQFGGTAPFVIEDGTSTWSQIPGLLPFAQGKVLSLRGWSADGAFGFPFVYSFEMELAAPSQAASLDLVYLVENTGVDWSGNQVTLEALSDGAVVASDAVFLDDVRGEHVGTVYGASTLAVAAASFDTLRLSASGPGNGGSVNGGIDHLVVVPEPAGAILLGLAALLATRVRRAG